MQANIKFILKTVCSVILQVKILFAIFLYYILCNKSSTSIFKHVQNS